MTAPSFAAAAPAPLLFGLDIPLARALGIEGVSIGDDRAQLRMPADAAFANSRGQVSGGALAAFFDCGLASAVRAHAPGAFGVVTVDLGTHFIAACEGTVHLTAWCDRRGRRLSFARGEARDGQGSLVATASGSFLLVPLPDRSPNNDQETTP